MTNKQKHIASCIDPKAAFTDKEIKKAKQLARGKFWQDKIWEEFVSFSPNGDWTFFEYKFNSWADETLKNQWIRTARQAARLWAQGNYKAANEVNANNWKSAR